MKIKTDKKSKASIAFFDGMFQMFFSAIDISYKTSLSNRDKNHLRQLRKELKFFKKHLLKSNN